MNHHTFDVHPPTYIKDYKSIITTGSSSWKFCVCGKFGKTHWCWLNPNVYSLNLHVRTIFVGICWYLSIAFFFFDQVPQRFRHSARPRRPYGPTDPRHCTVPPCGATCCSGVVAEQSKALPPWKSSATRRSHCHILATNGAFPLAFSDGFAEGTIPGTHKEPHRNHDEKWTTSWVKKFPKSWVSHWEPSRMAETYSNGCIWRFPEIGLPPVIIHL